MELTKNEELLLLSILKLKDRAYGVTIRKNYKAVTGKALNYGSMYNTLYLLVRRGLAVAKESEPESRKGGRRKILYSITSDGKKALLEAQKIHRSAWDGISDLAIEEKK
ncbi:PadR family transcriptional regulator [candidate division KSB1 bacterium]